MSLNQSRGYATSNWGASQTSGALGSSDARHLSHPACHPKSGVAHLISSKDYKNGAHSSSTISPFFIKMSLFKTLQNSPATISIFHNAKVPTSARVYANLEKAYYKLNENKNQFQIDLNAKQMPTYDQFKDIYLQFVHGEDSKTVLQSCYPLLSDKKTKESDQKYTTIKSLGVKTDRGFKVFSQHEYENIHEAFLSLVNEAEPEIDPSQLFRAPLLVDWDQKLIACDEEGLQAILAKYKAEQK